MVLKPETVPVSPHFHVVFYDKFYKVLFTRKGTITPNLTDLVQHISLRGAPENMDIKDTCFTKYFEEGPR